MTEVDKKIEKYLVDRIKDKFPQDQILGEEGFGHHQVNIKRGTVWFLDPIDGTLNFVKQGENFAVMIAVYDEGVGTQGYIYDVMNDQLFHAIIGHGVYCNGQLLSKPENLDIHEGLYASSSVFYIGDKSLNDLHYEVAKLSLGVRPLGSAGLEAVEVAKGNIVAYTGRTLMPWDIAAGQIILKEAGCLMTNLKGEAPHLEGKEAILMGTPKAHATVLDKFKALAIK